MANWKCAPLIYTLGMVQFPHLPIERFVDSFLDVIRNEYPLFEMTSIPVISAAMDPQGLQVSQQDSKMWQFLSIDKNWGFILNENSLCLHTVQYHDFADFSKRFRRGLEALLKVPEINISWTTALGIRYVDMIAPMEHALQEFLQPWILPTVPPMSEVTMVEGAYIARYNTGLGELRLQSIRNPPFTLPPELQSPFIIKNHWAKDRPPSDFAIVDTDHGIMYSEPKPIDIDDILSSLDQLHLITKKIFESMGTSMAIQVWRGEK